MASQKSIYRTLKAELLKSRISVVAKPPYKERFLLAFPSVASGDRGQQEQLVWSGAHSRHTPHQLLLLHGVGWPARPTQQIGKKPLRVRGRPAMQAERLCSAFAKAGMHHR